jgi:hypothetical protein
MRVIIDNDPLGRSKYDHSSEGHHVIVRRLDDGRDARTVRS